MYVRLDGGDGRRRASCASTSRRASSRRCLRGRAFTEAPDITARICGICPVAYQMSAVRAMEDACGVAIDDGPIRDLRRLIYCGEWIESHSLHVYMLHAPDFLGYAGAVEMARDHREIVEQGLQMKKAGNALMAAGRRARDAPDQRPRRRLLPRPDAGRAARRSSSRSSARARPRWRPSAGRRELAVPGRRARRRARRAARRRGDYPIDRGRIVSDRGLDIAPARVRRARRRGARSSTPTRCTPASASAAAYLTGPLARYASPRTRSRAAGPRGGARGRPRRRSCRNPFRSIVVRAVELVQACDEALRDHRRLRGARSRRPSRSRRARGVGHGATEAPRGLLYHRYEIDDDGTILDARIVPPTSQNQLAIEEDLRAVVERHARPRRRRSCALRCEQAIRNHDPCISCATHFLDARPSTVADAGRRA